MHFHPQPNELGERHPINHPTSPTPLENWIDQSKIATVVPAGVMPPELNGIAFFSWDDAPRSNVEWHSVSGQMQNLAEPPLVVPPAKIVTAGAVIFESDGRIWLVAPTNAFGGYEATFPKGKVEEGMSLQATAIREVFEETGLRIRVTGYLCDSLRSQSVARYYIAERIGGNPSDMGWESQAVHLVPINTLHGILNSSNDVPVIRAIKQHLAKL